MAKIDRNNTLKEKLPCGRKVCEADYACSKCEYGNKAIINRRERDKRDLDFDSEHRQEQEQKIRRAQELCSHEGNWIPFVKTVNVHRTDDADSLIQPTQMAYICCGKCGYVKRVRELKVTLDKI